MMAGHRPFSELTKHFTVEDWAYIDAGTARIREEVEREKMERAGREKPRRRLAGARGTPERPGPGGPLTGIPPAERS